MDRAKNLQDYIVADEIGLHSGRYGAYLLTSSFQPIYRINEGRLVPFAAEGLIKARLEGVQVPPKAFFSSLPDGDQLFVESLCRALHVRNFTHVGTEGLELFFNMNPPAHGNLSAALHDIRQMVRFLDATGFSTRHLVCEIVETKAVSNGTLRGIVKELRRHGIRIAVDDFGCEHSNMERVETLSPDIVKIDGEWFRQLVSFPASARLVATIVGGFREKGVQVLTEGIETADQLQAAIDAGVNYVQGFLLAGPQLAGADVVWETLDVSELLSTENKVHYMAN